MVQAPELADLADATKPCLWALSAQPEEFLADLLADNCSVLGSYAVTIPAADSRPSTRIDSSRILYFWTLPLIVIGQPSTKRM